MDYQAVLFDFDYTLADATESIYEGYCYSFGEMGLPIPSLERVREMVGYILEDSFTLLTGDDDPARRAQCRRLFQEKVDGRQAEKTVLCTGAAELLRTLRDCGVKVGIVSSKRSATLREILEYHRLMELVELVVGPDMVKKPKPDPEGLERAVRLLGVEKEKALYCGDTIIDAATGQAAGVDFSAVLNGVTPAAAFEPYPHVHIAPDLVELKAWLGL